jgi:hypothetical protein
VRSHIFVLRATAKFSSKPFVFKNIVTREGLRRANPSGLGAESPPSSSNSKVLVTDCVVRIIAEALRQARDTLQPRGTVHLFLAVPAGLAVMIGQTLNTFGPIQTYEHVGTDAVGVCQPAVLLSPSA